MYVCKICGKKVGDSMQELLDHLSIFHEESYMKAWNAINEIFEEVNE